MRRKQADERVRALNAELSIANRELQAFSSSISHDLRSPLRAIEAYALDMAQRYGAQLDELGRHLLEVMQMSSRKIIGLVESLLDFSRASRKPLEAQPVIMQPLAREVWQECASGAVATLQLAALPPAAGDPAASGLEQSLIQCHQVQQQALASPGAGRRRAARCGSGLQRGR